MGDVTSINKATTTSVSLRTTIPQSITTHFKLKEKDKLDWEIKAEDGNLIIRVTPIRNGLENDNE